MQGKKELTVEELLQLNEILGKIGGIDLDRLEAEKVEALRPMDKLVRDLEEGITPKGRYVKGKTGLGRTPKKKLHWKIRRRKYKEYYAVRGKRMRLDRRANQLKTKEGWYDYVTAVWKKKGMEFFTLKEWVEVIWPALDGKVPVFGRYDKTRGYTLDNIVVREDKVGTVLFDGSEYELRRLGYTL